MRCDNEMRENYQHQISKAHESELSNVIPFPLYVHTVIILVATSLILIILVASNKQFLNLNLLIGFLDQASKS